MTESLQSSISFEKLVMTKRSETNWDYRYENVCLVLDDVEKLCSSDNDYGQSLSVPGTREMIWSMPTTDVTKIELIFKKSSNPVGCPGGNYCPSLNTGVATLTG